MFLFGKHYGASICEISENDFHKNVAYLIVLGTSEEVTIIDKSGTHYSGFALMVKPMVEHKIVKSSSLVCNVFVAPHSAFAASLKQFYSENGILQLNPSSLPFNSKMATDRIHHILDEIMVDSNTNIDPRLAAVLDRLDEAPLKSSIADIAAQCDLSPSRLRALAKKQIGVSLSALFLWRKLVKSAEVLYAGASLSEAAQAGGFSDQAHFSRTMRQMFGITPGNSTHTLNY